MPTATDWGAYVPKNSRAWMQSAEAKALADAARADELAGRGAWAPAAAAPAGGGAGAGAGVASSPYLTAPAASGGDLPDSAAALQRLRDLQTQSLSGLTALLSRDTTAQKKAIEDAMYASQAESIGAAADLQRRKMLEGTFGRGVGSSSITVDLAGRLAQEENDALGRARREAFLGAEAEDRARMQADLALHNAGFGAATTGMQADMNVILANLARQQQGSQFDRDLAFRGSEGAANRGLTQTLASQDLAFRNQQLQQQNQQFNQNLSFLGSENAANRSHQTGMLGQQQDFMGGQNDLNRALQQQLASMGYDFQANQADQSRQFTAGQNQEMRNLQAQLAQMGYDFTGTQNDLNRQLQQAMLNQTQGWTGTQAQLNRDAQMQQLLLQLANSQDLAGGNLLAGGLGGIGNLIGQILQRFGQ